MSVNVYDPNVGLKPIAGVPIDSITDLEKTSIVVYCDTPGNVAAKVGKAHNFVFRPLSKFYICFKYANTAESEITLNINEVGAREVIINGTISSATNYSIPAGIYECVYDDTGGTTHGEYYISTNYFNAISPENEVVHFTSSDTTDANATSWTSVSTLYGYENNKTFFERVSQMFKNVRYLYKMLGTTDISSIGNGTVTDGISTLNSALNQYSLIYNELATNTAPKTISNIKNFKRIRISLVNVAGSKFSLINSVELTTDHIVDGSGAWCMHYDGNNLYGVNAIFTNSTTITPSKTTPTDANWRMWIEGFMSC